MKKIKHFISKNANLITILIAISGLVVLYYLIFGELPSEQRNLMNIQSLIGTIISIFGISITLIQIIAVKEISEVTQNTIRNTKDRMIISISVTDVNDAIKFVGEIENFIGNQKYEIAILRITDLRNKLIQFKSSDDFKSVMAIEHIETAISDLSIQILNLQAALEKSNYKFNAKKLMQLLQSVGIYLNDFQNNIKLKTV